MPHNSINAATDLHRLRRVIVQRSTQTPYYYFTKHRQRIPSTTRAHNRVMADAEAESRKEALRKKGQEFLEKAISQASTKGSTSKSSSLNDVKISARDGNAQAPLDPTLETVGVMVEGLRYYIAALVFVIASAVSLVLAKVRVIINHHVVRYLGRTRPCVFVSTHCASTRRLP